MRIKLTIAYNGKSFYGLQVQPKEMTVMGELYKALKELGIESKLHASGRTDRGVHATGQVLHCDLPEHWKDLKRLETVLNYHLPDSIRIKHIEEVADDFHARYSAKRRIYRYVASSHPSNPFEADFVTFIKNPINLERINEVMACFVGTHDFTYFKKSGGGTTNFVRTIYKAFAYEHQGKVIFFFEANGFLRSQIRMMVGALFAYNDGRLDKAQLIEQIDAKHQHYWKLAPENGLYLAKIKY